MPLTPARRTPAELRREGACLRAAASPSVVEFPLELLLSSEAHMLEAGLKRGDIEHDEEPTISTGAVWVAAQGDFFEPSTGHEFKFIAKLHFPTSESHFGCIVCNLECVLPERSGSLVPTTRSLLNVEVLRCPAMTLEPHVAHNEERLAKELIAHFQAVRQVAFRYGLARNLDKFRVAVANFLSQ